MKKSIVALLVIGVSVAGLILWLKPESEPEVEQVEPAPAVDESGLLVERVERPEVKLPVPDQEVAVVQKSDGSVYGVVDPEAGYKERLEAMRKLGTEMSTNDVAVLMAFLREPMPADAKLRPLSYNSIRNDAYEILLRQKALPEGMGELLVSGYNSSEQDDVWRNYCIQFMEPCYEKKFEVLRVKSGEDAIPPELQEIQDTLWTALGERDNSNAGTALLALDKLARNHTDFDKEQISAAMINLAQDKQATLANRVTALRLCGEQKNPQALELARDLARNSDITMLRCAAIATLGDLGTEDDLVLLEAFSASRDKRLQQIAQASLKKLSAE